MTADTLKGLSERDIDDVVGALGEHLGHHIGHRDAIAILSQVFDPSPQAIADKSAEVFGQRIGEALSGRDYCGYRAQFWASASVFKPEDSPGWPGRR